MADESGTQTWDSYWDCQDSHDWWTRPAPEVLDFIASQSARERPCVLDLGCGLGRHAVAFAQAGFHVTAVDRSERAVEHLRAWTVRLSLDIRVEVCDLRCDSLPEEAFDIVLSYNVIYHGCREQFAAAVARVRELLRQDGLLYFTCPTREDGKYGFGKEVAPQTFLCEKSITPNDIHYFADEADLDELLAGFRIVARRVDSGHWNHAGEEQFYSNWHVVAEKE